MWFNSKASASCGLKLLYSMLSSIFHQFNLYSREYFEYSPLLAAVLLVSSGQTLVSCSQLLFAVDRFCPQEKGWLCKTSQTSLPHRAITPCATEEWFGHARLQFFMVSSFSESITLVISPLAATMARWWQWQRQRSNCSWVANLAFYCKVLVQQHI